MPEDEKDIVEIHVDESGKELNTSKDDAEAIPTPETPKGPNVLQKFWRKYLDRKKLTIPLTVFGFLVLLALIPFTRYALAGLVVKKDVTVTVVDSRNNIAVSGVDVAIGGKTAKTDGQGKAIIRAVKVGHIALKATKKYYKDGTTSFVVGFSKTNQVSVKLEATGRQIPLHIVNKINGANIAGATIKVGDADAQTDQNGEATLVLPADQTNAAGTVSANGYNQQGVKVVIDQTDVKDNTFQLTPAGKVYFLSKLSGKIDVVKTDLDGGNRQVVLAGTGNEDDHNTVLLASRDWKYLALLSRRNQKPASLYLIDTSTDKLTEMDSGDATFTITGWSGHNFIYLVGRNSIQAWQPGATALKVYNADSMQLTTVEQTNAEGTGNLDYAFEILTNVSIMDSNVVYTKYWTANYYSMSRLAGKRMGVYSMRADGSNKQLIKDFDVGDNGNINVVLAKPDELYISVTNSAVTYFEYKDGSLQQASDVTSDSFSKFYPTFLASPNNQSTFWFEPRDGKNSLFIGSKNGDNPKEIANLSEYTPYGWYSDDYVLVSKNSSELYIMPSGGPGDKGQILKITDYHKPDVNFGGYGGGYGGF